MNKIDQINLMSIYRVYKQDNINYHKQINDSLIGKYKSIRYMACIKPSKLHGKIILEDIL
jgi:hypothetical protein